MWLWYDWDMSYKIWAIYTTPERAIRRLSNEGYGKIAFIPAGEEIEDVEAAIKAWEDAR